MDGRNAPDSLGSPADELDMHAARIAATLAIGHVEVCLRKFTRGAPPSELSGEVDAARAGLNRLAEIVNRRPLA